MQPNDSNSWCASHSSSSQPSSPFFLSSVTALLTIAQISSALSSFLLKHGPVSPAQKAFRNHCAWSLYGTAESARSFATSPPASAAIGVGSGGARAAGEDTVGAEERQATSVRETTIVQGG